MAVCYNVSQGITIEYSIIIYNTITHITGNNIQLSRQPLINKITKINQKHTHYYNTETSRT